MVWGGGSPLRIAAACLTNPAIGFLWTLRRRQHKDGWALKLVSRHYFKRYGLEIPPQANLGAGLYLGHPFNITVNPKAILGDNCNLHKGVTIGQENRGKRKGAPTLGDRVWVGVNASIVGAVIIGSDVLVAPNSYVNEDVPSHSVVLGNPCRVFHRDDATEGYINQRAEA